MSYYGVVIILWISVGSRGRVRNPFKILLFCTAFFLHAARVNDILFDSNYT
jgi:hypothetical protein